LFWGLSVPGQGRREEKETDIDIDINNSALAVPGGWGASHNVVSLRARVSAVLGRFHNVNRAGCAFATSTRDLGPVHRIVTTPWCRPHEENFPTLNLPQAIADLHDWGK
jgi:hypothetical protein